MAGRGRQPRQKLEVVAERVDFLDRKPSDDAQQPEAVEAAA
jgi:hypothetical protein